MTQLEESTNSAVARAIKATDRVLDEMGRKFGLLSEA